MTFAVELHTAVVPLKRSAFSRLDDEQVIARITPVKGVGRWTAEMLLIFKLGRPDVLPVDDFGVRKGFSVADGRAVPVTPRELPDIGVAWALFRCVAA